MIANVTIPQLDPLPIPAPPGLLWFLMMLGFLLHLLPMNFVLGGTPIALAARWRARDGLHPQHAALARWFARALPVAIAAAVTFGVVPLLFVQALYGRLFFTSAVLLARYWFAVVPVLILCYYGAYLLAFRQDLPPRAAVLVAALATLGFFAIGFVYSNTMSLMLRPDVFAAWYSESGRGLHLNTSDPTLWPRYLHFVLGAAGVAGLVIAWFGVAQQRSHPDLGRWAVRYGGGWCAIATLLNFIVGLWWLGVLPRDLLLEFFTGGSIGAVGFGIGIATGLAALVLAAVAAFHPAPLRPMRYASLAMLVTLVGMILARDRVRQSALDSHGFVSNPWIAPQWGPIAIFAALMVAAIALVVWMIVALARGTRR